MSNPDVASVPSAFTSPQTTPAQNPVSNATPPPTIPTQKVETPFRSAEAFDAYCAQVQARLAEHAAQRIHFLQSAYDRLTRLLQTARAVEDPALSNELAQYRIAATELLEALKRLPQMDSRVSTLPMSEPVSPAGVNGRYTIETRREEAQPIVQAAASSPFQTTEEPAPTPVAPRLPRRPMRPLADIEADAVRLRAELRDWNNRYPLTSGQGELSIPNCLRLRAMACRQRRLEEESGDTEITEVAEFSEDIVDILDAANDQEYTVALDDELDPRPTAWQWGELADRYEEMAKAQEAFEWWNQNRNGLTVADIQPLAEAVAAIQQRFNRLLFRVGARDPFQQQLFDDLRTWAREDQCYLYSLRPKVPVTELVERAGTLEEAWEKAKIPVAEEEHRQKTVDNVIAMVSAPEFGSQPEPDEVRLREALIECKQLRIPASDRRLRDALLPWGAFLESDERFKEIVREINLEWERRQESNKSEASEEESDAPLDVPDAELEAVREVARGKRCLFLGGTCREENRKKLETALELSELVWPSTKPSDPLSKFETEIRHSDIVVLLTRFSRKEWKNAQDICDREGKKFVHLTTGYGVAQVVRHFYEQICPQGATHA
jgi:hypothetical protein